MLMTNETKTTSICQGFIITRMGNPPFNFSGLGNVSKPVHLGLKQAELPRIMGIFSFGKHPFSLYFF